MMILANLLMLLAAMPVRIAVLGDRTGSPDNAELEIAVESIRLMSPDVILTVGDFVEGNGDVDTAVEDWGYMRPVLNGLEEVAPVIYTPGNNDIWNVSTAEYWTEFTGTRPDHISEAMGIQFLVWDSSIGEVLSREDLAGIETLSEGIDTDSPWIFVTHKPFWFMADQDPDIIAEFRNMMERLGPLAVVGGHIHRYASERVNGILYLSAGSSGSAVPEPEPERGRFTQLGWMTVWPDSVAYTVIDSRSVFPEDLVTGEEMRLDYLYRHRMISMDPIEPDRESMNITLIPFEALPREVTITADPGNWGLRPESLTVILEDTVTVSFTQDHQGDIYPSPVLSVSLPCGAREKRLSFTFTPQVMRRINAFRDSPVLDGEITPGEYREAAQGGFADFSGAPSPLEGTSFTAAHDGERLFLAVSTGERLDDEYCGFILSSPNGSYIWVKVFGDESVDAKLISPDWGISELTWGFDCSFGDSAVEVAFDLNLISIQGDGIPAHVYRSAGEDFGTWVYPVAIDHSTLGRIWLEEQR